MAKDLPLTFEDLLLIFWIDLQAQHSNPRVDSLFIVSQVTPAFQQMTKAPALVHTINS
jgi:hypothetical protein